MHLSTFTDYAMRTLIYIGLQRDRLVTIAEIARAYGISENHLMKVVHHLAQRGRVETIRGKGGGLRLAMAPASINIGTLVRATEGSTGLLQCLDGQSDCCIQRACRLTGILREAQDALFAVLDKYTLDDLLCDEPALAGILMRQQLVGPNIEELERT